MGDLIFQVSFYETEHNGDYSINAGFDTQFSRKDEVTAEFDVTLNLMLIVSSTDLSKTRLNTRF